MAELLESLNSQLGTFIPQLLGAILILILGWLFAIIAASTTLNLLKKTDLDNRLANWILGGKADAKSLPNPEFWVSQFVFWVIMIFVVVAFLRALNLETVTGPLNTFLDEIFEYLPNLGGAALLLGVAWAIATVSKLILTRGLERFQLDDQLAEQTGTRKEDSPFLVNETLGNLLYWFIFLFFLPLILETLELEGSSLAPVQNLLDQLLSAVPRILTAIIYAGLGWLVARIVRGIVTNLLMAAGVDRMGSRFGFSQETDQTTLSSLLGTLVYVLILIPTVIAALDALAIEAISDPAIRMLEQVTTVIPKVFAAALILVLFFLIGRFVSDLIAQLLTGVGFNNVWMWLGLPAPTATDSPPEPSDPEATEVLPSTSPQTPSQIVGTIALVVILLFGTIPATEVLEFQSLTLVVQEILAILARVLIGILIFGIGLYLANLVFNVLTRFSGPQARVLAQAARIAIWVFVGAMALQQMGVATDIVVLAFGLTLGAIAVALSLAFGLGGRDVAAEHLRQWLASFDPTPASTEESSEPPQD